MNRIIVLVLVVSFGWSCQKSPSPNQLLGTWTELNDNADKSKLIFWEGDSLYFFYSARIDTLSYVLDSKHNTLFLTLIHHPTIPVTKCTITYHKRKKILTIVGLLPPKNGRPTTANYRQQNCREFCLRKLFFTLAKGILLHS